MGEERVCVVGLGYIGLPTAAFLADSGHLVFGCDLNKNYVDTINNGEVPFFEPGFSELLKKVVSNGNLTADVVPHDADTFIVAVPTPFQDDHSVDISFIESAAKSIAPLLKANNLVVLESTSPPGTTDQMAEIILNERPDLSVDPDSKNSILVAHCPERVLPGQIMKEMSANDRVVGGINQQSSDRAAELYASFCAGEILKTNATTAEMAKLTENSFRDVNIAFANELSLICDRLGINVWELIEIANHHPRVNILQPGPGVGGHCIAVDPWFIVSSAPEEAKLIHTARNVNDGKPEFVIKQVIESIQGKESPVIAALGLAFKANIDDLRESPAVEIVKNLAQRVPNARIMAVEPNIHDIPSQLAVLPNVSLSGLDDALSQASTVVLLVDHNEFLKVGEGLNSNQAVVDTRGAWR